VGFGSTWGVVTKRQDAADRQRLEDRAQLQAVQADAAALRVRVASVETEQNGARRLLDTEVAGLRREVERLARAVERLTDEPPRT
jgi:predicted  nucleic acid-binding Zn-ribbon protein